MVSNYVALIPARGGSKGLAKKNIAPLLDRPLIDYTIEAARDSSRIGRIIVSTDDSEIASFALERGCEIHRRPAHLASDLSRVVDTVIETISSMHLPETDAICILQPTSPLRDSAYVQSMIQLHSDHPEKTIVSVVEHEHHPMKSLSICSGVLQPVFEQHYLEASRQELPRLYRPNGAAYISLVSTILEHKTLVPQGSLAFEMPKEDSIDIDSALDLEFASLVISRRMS